MGLAPGTKFGPYEIAEPLGAGGMGEVYRALDSRLDRAVAVKVLATHLSADPELRQRFDREARAISSLQHPNICTLFDVGHQDGVDFLVMELLEGETLADRLKRGPLPVEQAVRIAIEVADALEKAHRQGIVHRDLKPGNVMVSKSGTKLMDFGLAKPASAMAAVASATGSAVTPTTPTSPTIAALAAPTSPITGRGLVVGTFQYIAPEVLQGGEASPRSDIFALGAVLYEMLTGQRAFEGKSQLSVASAILEKEPAAVSSIQPMTPPALEQVVKICLAKDPEERFQTAHDLKLQLKWIADASTSQLAAPAQVRARRALQKRTLMIAAAVGWLLAAAALAFFLSSRSQLEEARRPVTASWTAPTGTEFASVVVGAPALSPDGSKLAFMTGTLAEPKLWIRDVTSGTVRAIEGVEQPTFPFWSPDGKYIGFFSAGKLKKVALAGGPVQLLCEAPEGRGAAWSQKGVIIFTPNIRESLYKVAEGGGTPEKITEAKPGWTHRNPYFLPDGDHYLFISREAAAATGPAGALWGGSLSGDKPRQILERGSNVQYTEGYLLYLRDTVLVAQRFDPKSLKFSGDAIPVAEKLDTWNARDLVAFTAAHGALVYRHGALQKSQPMLVDGDGRELARLADPGLYAALRTSHDGSLLGLARMDADTGRGDVWIIDVKRNTMSRSTFADAGNISFDFSPDSKRIVVSTIAGSVAGGTWIQPTSGSGTKETLESPSTWGFVSSWSPDGRYLFYIVQNNATRTDVYYLDLNGDKKLRPFVQSPANETFAVLSPNGKWLAYASDESGRFEIYVTAFPGPGGKWQVSNGGGAFAAWGADGKQLYYAAGDKVMAVPIQNLQTFEFGKPAALPLHANEFAELGPPAPGGRFPALKAVSGGQSHPQEVVFNWTGALKK
ncbi:MAG TPA: protein kinase [Terriglobales bacterium]|nr:protein kinase [Terriglobales bacterium]